MNMTIYSKSDRVQVDSVVVKPVADEFLSEEVGFDFDREQAYLVYSLCKSGHILLAHGDHTLTATLLGITNYDCFQCKEIAMAARRVAKSVFPENFE